MLRGLLQTLISHHLSNGGCLEDIRCSSKNSLHSTYVNLLENSYRKIDNFHFDGRYVHIGHLGYLLNYAYWKKCEQHVFEISKRESSILPHQCIDVLPHYINFKYSQNDTRGLLGDCPDVLSYLDEEVINHHLSTNSHMMLPPVGYVHNMINNHREYLGEVGSLGPTVRNNPPIRDRYVVLHLRTAEQDPYNRNFRYEERLLSAIQYLEYMNIGVVQIGLSRKKLTGPNLEVVDMYSGDDDIHLVANSLGYIGSASGPSCWYEYLGKPALLLDVGNPLACIHMHVAPRTMVLPKKDPFTSRLHSLFQNVTDLDVTGLLWWGCERSFSEISCNGSFYSSNAMIDNAEADILASVKYFTETLLLKNRSFNYDYHLDISPFLFYSGLRSNCILLSPQKVGSIS